MILLELNGNLYDNFKSIKVRNSVENLSGEFQFVATARAGESFPVLAGSSVRVIVDNTPVITGFVEVVNPTYNARSHRILIQGRDKTSTVIDSTIGSGLEFKGSISFKTLIEQILSKSGISNVGVIDKAEVSIAKNQIVSHKRGRKIFELLDKYARKLQVILTSDGNGNIVITRTGVIRAPSHLQLLSLNNPESKNNNIKSAKVKYDLSQRYGRYIVHSQIAPVLAFDDNLQGATQQQLTSNKFVVTDPSINQSRVLNLKSEVSTNESGCKERANWEANIRRIRSFSYSATVVGHSVNGQIWEPNTQITVIDDFANLNGDFLINEVEYLSDPERDGNITNLGIVYQDAFDISPTPPKRDKNTEFGGELVFDESRL